MNKQTKKSSIEVVLSERVLLLLMVFYVYDLHNINLFIPKITNKNKNYVYRSEIERKNVEHYRPLFVVVVYVFPREHLLSSLYENKSKRGHKILLKL